MWIHPYKLNKIDFKVWKKCHYCNFNLGIWCSIVYSSVIDRYKYVYWIYLYILSILIDVLQKWEVFTVIKYRWKREDEEKDQNRVIWIQGIRQYGVKGCVGCLSCNQCMTIETLARDLLSHTTIRMLRKPAASTRTKRSRSRSVAAGKGKNELVNAGVCSHLSKYCDVNFT